MLFDFFRGIIEFFGPLKMSQDTFADIILVHIDKDISYVHDQTGRQIRAVAKHLSGDVDGFGEYEKFIQTIFGQFFKIRFVDGACGYVFFEYSDHGSLVVV